MLPAYPNLLMVFEKNHCPQDRCGCHILSPIFNLLTDEEQDYLGRNRQIVRYHKGEILRKQGTAMSHVLSVNAGLVKVYLEGPSQRNTIIRIVQAPQFIGGPGVHFDRLHHYSILALTDAIVCMIDAGVFLELLKMNQRFNEAYMKDYSANVLIIYNRLATLNQKQMHGRMADGLLYLSDEIFGSDLIPDVISRQDIAELTGLSRETATKVLREFHKSGLLEQTRRSIQLLDRDGLIRVSQKG